MKKKLVLQFLPLLALGGATGWFIRNQTLNPRASFPAVFERPLASIISGAESEEGDILYGDVNLTDFIKNGSGRTKVAVVGKIGKVMAEPDGDYHVLVGDSAGNVLVTEFIPEVKLPMPREGDSVKIWGITRFDIFHNWWEIHPVIGWTKV